MSGAALSTTHLMKDECLLRLQTKVIQQYSCVHQLLHWFHECACPCLSRAKLLWVCFQMLVKEHQPFSSLHLLPGPLTHSTRSNTAIPWRCPVTAPPVQTVLRRAQTYRDGAEECRHGTTRCEMGQGDLVLGHYCLGEQRASTWE